MVQEDWILNLEDNEWTKTTIDHDRMIANREAPVLKRAKELLLHRRK